MRTSITFPVCVEAIPNGCRATRSVLANFTGEFEIPDYSRNELSPLEGYSQTDLTMPVSDRDVFLLNGRCFQRIADMDSLERGYFRKGALGRNGIFSTIKSDLDACAPLRVDIMRKVRKDYFEIGASAAKKYLPEAAFTSHDRDHHYIPLRRHPVSYLNEASLEAQRGAMEDAARHLAHIDGDIWRECSPPSLRLTVTSHNPRTHVFHFETSRNVFPYFMSLWDMSEEVGGQINSWSFATDHAHAADDMDAVIEAVRTRYPNSVLPAMDIETRIDNFDVVADACRVAEIDVLRASADTATILEKTLTKNHKVADGMTWAPAPTAIALSKMDVQDIIHMKKLSDGILSAATTNLVSDDLVSSLEYLNDRDSLFNSSYTIMRRITAQTLLNWSDRSISLSRFPTPRVHPKPN